MRITRVKLFCSFIIFSFFAVLFGTDLSAQVFIPFGYWRKLIVAAVNYSPTISSISNRNIYEGNNPFIPFTISDLNDTLSCTITHLSATSSNTAVYGDLISRHWNFNCASNGYHS